MHNTQILSVSKRMEVIILIPFYAGKNLKKETIVLQI